MVHPERNSTFFQGWKMADCGSAEEEYSKFHDCGKDSGSVFDMGEHCVGYLKFRIDFKTEKQPPDCPVRLKITFGEVPAEIGEDFGSYSGGLSGTWLQEETLVVDDIPAEVKLPRRYAFRYVSIKPDDNRPRAFKIGFRDVTCESLTSADENAVPSLPPGASDEMELLDKISLNTIKNCMQGVFEDGPKRDRRLWLGDFYLQAQLNYLTFKNYSLCKKCLLLFAGCTNERGLIPSCVYERPQPHRAELYIYDYTALFAATLLDYAHASGDWDCAGELWPVALRQVDFLTAELDNTGLFQDGKSWWLFIDWNNALDKQAAEQASLIYSLRKTLELANALKKEKEAAFLKEIIAKTFRAAKLFLFDEEKGIFVSGLERQVSWISQALMRRAGVIQGEDACRALKAALSAPDAVKPVSPYSLHCVVEALFEEGMIKEAERIMLECWGAMAKLGADTFWEVFDPQNHFCSPYGSHLINSYCHAWSCTPAYFIRKFKR